MWKILLVDNFINNNMRQNIIKHRVIQTEKNTTFSISLDFANENNAIYSQYIQISKLELANYGITIFSKQR